MALAACLSAPDAWSDAAPQKFALLIENDAYPDGDPASIADQDASTLAATLKKIGFEVELKRNVDRRTLASSIAALIAKTTPGSVALFYYKGIAIQASQIDYLAPVDASIWSEDDLRREGARLDRLLSDLDRRGAGKTIAVVDAARPNPFERRFRVYSAGLAPVAAQIGALVMFADAANTVAEPAKAHSLFMTELVKQIDTQGPTEAAFARTRESVAKLSNGREQPWVSSTFAAPSGQSHATPRPAQPPAALAGTPPKPPAAAPPKPAVALAPVQPPAPVPAPTEKPAAKPNPEPRPGRTFSDCAHCPDMTVIPAASFEMGSGATPYDRPVHRVTIAEPFAISLAPVTRDEWAVCAEEGGCAAKPKADGGQPVVNVTWNDAVLYAAFLSKKTGRTYRLPTEAEWEYAARGGTTTVFAWGDAPGVGHANCTDCGGRERAEILPVRSFPKNGFGLYDMAGNVAQWLQDCWRLTYRDAPSDGSAPVAAACDMRVVRGGSFETTSAYIKPTARFRAAPDTRLRSIGFRVVRETR